MHADEAGDDRAAGDIDDAGAGRDLHLGIRAERLDAAITEQDRAAVHGRCAGPIDHTGADQRDDRLAHRDIAKHLPGEGRLPGGQRRGGEQRGQDDDGRTPSHGSPLMGLRRATAQR